MKCALCGPNARIFAKAVQSLAKFGTDLFIEVDQTGFQLRSVNANRSAVGTFKFWRLFFDDYDISGGSSDDDNYCRLSLKAVLGVFKSMKLVETCHIHIDTVRFKFIVQMDCRFEIVKHFIISIIDDENISADVPMDDLPNLIQGSYKLFHEITSNFQTSEEELTLEIHNDTLTAKNYVSGSRVNDKFMRSQLKLDSAEFDEYKISEETSVTFCLREFRAFLLFAEPLRENVNIMFRDAGSPIIFRTKKANYFEATLIMSTLSPDDVTMCDDLEPKEITESFVLKNAQKSPQKRKTSKDPPNKSKRVNSTKNTTERESTSIAARESTSIAARESTSVAAKESTSTEETPDFRFDGHSIDLLRNHASAGTSDEMPRIPSTSAASNAMEAEYPAQSESEVFVTFVETEDNVAEDEQIPQSPGHSQSTERRGLRSIFSRCFEETYVPREPSPTSQVYVPDSDDEN